MKRFLKILLGIFIICASGEGLPIAKAAPQAMPGASILYVKFNGTGVCKSWNDACGLSMALANAPTGSEIWVAKGVYKPSTTTTSDRRSATILLKPGVALYGGFAGTETERQQRDIAKNVTVFSGDLDGDDITDFNHVVTNTANIIGTNAWHVITANSVTTTAVLDGFTITAGMANGEQPDNSGGGIYNNNANPTLANLIFSGNAAHDAGGGIYNDYGRPTLTNVTFKSNAASRGGGMHNYHNGNPTLTNVIFSSNLADSGGGMYNSNSSPKLTNVTFNSNSASSGGGIYNHHSNPKLTNVAFNENDADSGGGMHNWNDSNPTLINVAFNGNKAESGGGMYNRYSNPKLTNVTISGNKADSGGGMYNSINSSPILFNTILWGNQAITDSQVSNSSITIHYSLIQDGCPTDGDCNDHLLTSDPRFVDEANGDLRLQGDSPAIDAGDNTVTDLTYIITDLDGKPRFLDAPAGDTGKGFPPMVDLGAYEYEYIPPSNTNTFLTAAPNPSQAGQIVTFLAVITTTPGGPIPAGNVIFSSAEVQLGSSSLNNKGTATFSTSTLSVGTHTITASYTGGADFTPSISNSFIQTVEPYHINLPLIERNWPPVVLIDDASDYCKDAYTISTLDKSYQDDFDKDPDPDWYRFGATKGTHYNVNVTAGANTTPVLRLYDSECNYMELQGTPVENGTRLIWEHGWASGWYYLLIYEGHGHFGAETRYQLSIQANP